MDWLKMLDDLKRKRRIKSDYAAGKLLGITTARLSDYRHGRRNPDIYARVKLALEMGIDPLRMIAEAEAHKERSESRRAFWRDFLRRAATRAIIPALLFTGFSSTAPEARDNPLTYHTLCEVMGAESASRPVTSCPILNPWPV